MKTFKINKFDLKKGMRVWAESIHPNNGYRDIAIITINSINGNWVFFCNGDILSSISISDFNFFSIPDCSGLKWKYNQVLDDHCDPDLYTTIESNGALCCGAINLKDGSVSNHYQKRFFSPYPETINIDGEEFLISEIKKLPRYKKAEDK